METEIEIRDIRPKNPEARKMYVEIKEDLVCISTEGFGLGPSRRKVHIHVSLNSQGELQVT